MLVGSAALPRRWAHVVHWSVVLYLALFALSVFIVLLPDLPVSAPNPLVAVALTTLASMVALALLQLGFLRFEIFGHALDLFAVLAFGALALSNILLRTLGPLAHREGAPYEVNLHLLLLTSTIAAALFFTGLSRADWTVDRLYRRRFAIRASLAVVASLTLGTIIVLVGRASLPSVLDPTARQLLERNSVIIHFLDGQAAWVLMANAGIALLLFLAAAGYLRWGLRSAQAHFVHFGIALTLLFFGQLHTLTVPPVSVDYVSISDGFRLAAYLVLLLSMAAGIGNEIAEHAKADERLRLSRELHDGLVQQLSLVNLWLTRSSDAGRAAEKRASELETAKRILEAALLEARQVITSLRTGQVTWVELTRSLSAYANELAQNHEIQVGVHLLGSTPPVAVALQIELLRVLQEAFSNATRHGGARAVEITLTGSVRELTLRVSDDGCGFEPSQAFSGSGMGLRSFRERLARRGGTCAIESAPGRGATVCIQVPLTNLRSAPS